ncbi:MAG TPA: aspartate kinase, partial [Pedobacter sp.]
MKILKFGGTSVGSPERMKSLLDIINPKQKQLVVLSAVSGTTNALVEISQAFLDGNKKKAKELTDALHEKYNVFVKELFSTSEGAKN